MHHKTEAYTCEVTEIGTGPVEDECDYPNEDDAKADPLRTPSGWLEVRLRIKLPSTEYAQAQQERETTIQRKLAMVMSGIEAAQQTTEAIAFFRAEVESQVDEGEEDPFVVNEVTLHYSQDWVYAAIASQLGGGGQPATLLGEICEQLGLPVPVQVAPQAQAQPVQAAPVQVTPAPVPQPVPPQPMPFPQQATPAMMAPIGGAGPATLVGLPQPQPQAAPAAAPMPQPPPMRPLADAFTVVNQATLAQQPQPPAAPLPPPQGVGDQAQPVQAPQAPVPQPHMGALQGLLPGGQAR